MSEPFLGEIKMTGFGFAPRGWAFCNGQLLSISQNTALFSILGTTYGGDGWATFGLPDLRGRMPVHGDTLGERGGEAQHTVTLGEMPSHNHAMLAATTVSHAADPTGRVLGSVEAGALNIYHAADGTAALHQSTLSQAGGSQPHNNMQPYCATNFIIALQGIFPSRD
ncbi:phage tail protein [Rugamonas apoptosis]|uniref:Phage tail protein n=1 Tax=Rugamonas apoptosis TaxID=2758570 RepID=A0A7W2F5J6_9BURK|nr:tail fiber protein [Rugamonas apoptosis]MBA5685479.1 phage tail protein [Rugamonas apoptosis]